MYMHKKPTYMHTHRQGVVETQAALDQLACGDSYVRSVCFSPDSKFLIAGAEDKTIKVRHGHGHGHGHGVFLLSTHPKGK
jgi:WD40 repeat protein